MPGPCPEPERAGAGDPGPPQFAWAPGSAETGPVPAGLGLDGHALLGGLAAGGFLDGDPDEQDAVLAAEPSWPPVRYGSSLRMSVHIVS
jgi:hypothetical protein